MLKSMTGFGKSICELPDKKLTIEIKSLNSKQIDTNTRLPSIYREKELDIRNLLAGKLTRGKIDFSIHYEILEGTASIVNPHVVKDYYRQLSSIAFELGVKDQDQLLQSVMRLPDTLTNEKSELNTEEWEKVLEAIQEAMEELDNFRLQEGAALGKDLGEHVGQIIALLDRVDEHEEERVERIRERLRTSLEEMGMKQEIDQNRFEQELVFYIEKLDISEEKVRLAHHCNYFLEVMDTDPPNGKKLAFISQEIGTEINTLGSKANHSEMQRLVVEMKDELEKIKEQLLNVL